MIITHEIVVKSWGLLITTPPFRRWKLPSSDEIEFHVYKKNDGRRGEYVYIPQSKRPVMGAPHKIRINNGNIVTLNALFMVLAHEAAHLRQQLEYPTDQAHHGKRFQQYAKQICRAHNWTVEEF